MLTFHGLLDEVKCFVLNDVQPTESGLVLQPNAFRQFLNKPIRGWNAHRIK